MSYPTITLEEHFFSKTLAAKGKLGNIVDDFPPQLSERLLDFDALRIEAMDKGNVSVQIISHGPCASNAEPEDVVAANNELFEACKAKPESYAGFGGLPMAHPAKAVEEMKRCMTHLGFKGVLVDNHLMDGRYFDDEFFWPVFEAAQEMDVPFYIHPTFPVEETKRVLYKGAYSDGAAFSLGTSAWGWHQDTGLHILKLHAAGVFEKFPRLKIIIGHMGEMLPFMLDRVHRRSSSWMEGKTRSIVDVYNENIWITTSSFFSLDPLACLLRNTKPERIMYSVDYPFSDTETGWGFLESLRTSGMVSQEVFEGIAWKNAEKLFGVKASPVKP